MNAMDDMVKEAVLSTDEENAEENRVVVDSVKHYDDRNEVIVEGPVVNIFETEGSTLLTVLTNTGRNGQETSGVTISVRGDLREAAKEFKVGNRVHVEGKLYSRMLHDDPPVYEMAVRATKLEALKSDMEEEFGLTGRTYNIPYNRITLTGDIFRMTQINRNTVTVLLLVREEGERPRYIEVTIFANNLKRLLPDLVVGNRVIMICEYRVRKREGREGEKAQYFRNIVALDFKSI